MSFHRKDYHRRGQRQKQFNNFLDKEKVYYYLLIKIYKEDYMKRRGIQLFLAVVAVLLAVTLSFAASDTGSTTAEPAKKTAAKKQKSKYKAAQHDLVDINTASGEQMKALPGLSDEDVKKIIDGRPYTRKNQLKQKNIITAAAYDGIKKMIVAKKAAKPAK
jgi:competence protein ComEA